MIASYSHAKVIWYVMLRVSGRAPNHPFNKIRQLRTKDVVMLTSSLRTSAWLSELSDNFVPINEKLLTGAQFSYLVWLVCDWLGSPSNAHWMSKNQLVSINLICFDVTDLIMTAIT